MANKKNKEKPKANHLIYFIDKTFLVMVFYKMCLFLNKNSVQHTLSKRKINTSYLFINLKEYILLNFSIAQSFTYH